MVKIIILSATLTFFPVDGTVTNSVYSLEGDRIGTGSSVEHKFQNPIYGPGKELESESKTGTGSTSERQFTNSTYEATSIQRGNDYLYHPSTSHPAHPVKAGTTSRVNEQPVYDEANLPPPTTSAPEKKVTSKSQTAYEEINDEGEIAPSGVYDKTLHTSSPSNTNSGLEAPINIYSTLDEPTHAYSALEGPTEAYSELSRPEDVSPYDVTNHGHPQTQPQTLPPHEAALYDTANYPNEPTAQHDYDYTETADFIGLPSDSSVRPHSYDYVDTHLDGKGVAISVPPAVDLQVRPVYTNTLPGKITAEAESHYDLGQ